MRDLSGRKLDAFDWAGLQLTDEQKQSCFDLVIAYRAAGINVTVEMLIDFITRPSPCAGGDVEALSPPSVSVAISAEGGT